MVSYPLNPLRVDVHRSSSTVWLNKLIFVSYLVIKHIGVKLNTARAQSHVWAWVLPIFTPMILNYLCGRSNNDHPISRGFSGDNDIETTLTTSIQEKYSFCKEYYVVCRQPISFWFWHKRRHKRWPCGLVRFGVIIHTQTLICSTNKRV